MVATFAERAWRFATGSHLRATTVLLVLALACFLPGFVSMQPMDRDEPRFAQASKQMLENKDFVDIRFQDEARHKKPVGIYWLQAASVSIGEVLGVDHARTAIWLYRIPSLLGALGAVLALYWAALVLLSRQEAFMAAAFFAASVLLGVEARLAKTDAVLCLTAVVAFGILARAYILRQTTGIGPREAMLFWLAIGFSVLIKGPVVPMVVVLAAAVLWWRERSGLWLRALLDKRAIGLALLVVAPWFAAIAIKSGGSFFQEAVGHDMLGKVGSGQEKHWGPPGAYLAVFPITFWPASALAVLAIPFIWRNRRDDVIAFCLAWIIPSWLVFEAIPTKLPHYVLPLFPAIAVLTARALGEGQIFTKGGWRRAASLILPGVPLILTLAGTGVAWFVDGTIPYLGLPLLIVATLLSVWIWRALQRGGSPTIVPPIAVTAAIFYLAVYQLTWPAMRAIQLSLRLAEAVRAAPCAAPAIVTSGYREPSLVFLTSTDLAMAEGAGAAQFLAGPGCRLALVESRQEAAFRDELAKRNLNPRLLTRVRGVNINQALEKDRTLRRMDIGVYLSDMSRP